MGPQDVHHHGRAVPAVLIDADDHVVAPLHDGIDPALVLGEVVAAGKTPQGPSHVRPHPRPAEAPARAQGLFDQRQHVVHVEMPVTQVGVFPCAQFEVPCCADAGQIDAGFGKPLLPLVDVRWIQELKAALAAMRTVGGEGKQDPVFLLGVAEESACMAGTGQVGAPQRHRPARGCRRRSRGALRWLD
jgi:hypothetical protein